MKRLTLKELRDVCQAAIRMRRYSWWLKNFSRRFSILLTYIFMHTNITANQVTFMSVIVIFAAGVFFLLGSPWSVLAGAFLFQVFYIFDACDGEVVRMREYFKTGEIQYDKGTFNYTGYFLDHYLHYLFAAYIFFCLGWGQYRFLANSRMIILGFIAAVSFGLIELLIDCKHTALMKAVSSAALAGREVCAKKAQGKEGKSEVSLPRKVFSFLHDTCFFYNIMNFVSVAAVLNLFIPALELFGVKINLMVVVLLYYAVIETLVWTFKLIHTVLKCGVDTERERIFEIR